MRVNTFDFAAPPRAGWLRALTICGASGGSPAAFNAK
jgi:hypothetical protein